MSAVRLVLSKRSTFFFLVGAGLAIRLLFLPAIVHQPLMSDAADYDEMALRLLRGEAFVPYWPPGLPLYLAAIHGLFGSSTVVVRLAMLLFYAGTSWFLYSTTFLVTREPTAGNIAVALLAMSPSVIHSSIEPLTQLPTAMFLMIIGCCMLRLYTEVSAGNVGLVAISIGCAGLIRPSTLVLIVIFPLYLLWRTRRLLPAASAFLVGVVIIGAWIGYVHQKTGRFVKINTANSRNFYLGNNPYTPVYRTWQLGSHHDEKDVPRAYLEQNAAIRKLDLVPRDAEYMRLAEEHIRQHPGMFLLRTFNRICAYFAFDTFAGSFLIAFYGFPKIVGLVVLAIDALFYLVIAIGSILYLFSLPDFPHCTPRQNMLLGLALLYAAPYFIAFSHPSYHFPIEPILMALASAFFVLIISGQWNVVRAALHRRSRMLAIVLLSFAFVQIEFLVAMSDRIR